MYSTDLPLAYEGYKAVTMSKNKDEAAKGFVRWLVKSDVKKIALVAENEGIPVGIAVTSINFHPYEYPEVYGYADLLYIRKAFRNSGIAKELIAMTREWLMNNKVPQVFGIHRKENDVFWNEITKTYPDMQKVASVWKEEYSYVGSPL
jgi:GNAT superfamily N-acetyltransferase